MKVHKFRTSQKAWEGLNKYFLNNLIEIEEHGGGRYGGQMTDYDNIVYIQRAKVDPKFDFGNMFGYRPQKWSGLLNNYVDKEALQDLKDRVQERENKKAKHYNLSMVFSNKHGHGKNCLMSLTLSRRQNNKKPVASFTLRSSEITKRLLMDLLLVQRMIEFIYGHNKVGIVMFATNIYQNAEAFTMYDNHEKIATFLDKKGGIDKWQQKILALLTKFQNCSVEEITMKVHKRCVRQLQRPNGVPLSGDRPMLAKELNL